MAQSRVDAGWVVLEVARSGRALLEMAKTGHKTTAIVSASVVGQTTVIHRETLPDSDRVSAPTDV